MNKRTAVAVGIVAAALVALGLKAGTQFVTLDAKTAAPTTVNLSGVSAAAGTSLSFAAADHVHSITGTVPAANGGTAQSTYAQGDILYASATNVLSKLAKGTAGQLLQIGATVPAWAGEQTWTAPSLLNSWVQSAGAQTIGYRKDADGTIHLRGSLKNGTAINTTGFTLPTGYRPTTGTPGFVVRSFNGVPTDIYAVVTVDTSGNVVLGANNTGATNSISIDGITFDTR